ERAESNGLPLVAGDAILIAAFGAYATRSFADAERRIAEGLAYFNETGRELSRQYLLSYRATLELEQGRWTDAVGTRGEVLRVPRASITPRIHALTVIGLVRARRGDPDPWSPLEEAHQLAVPSGELPRIAPPAIARAEAAWLEGRLGEIAGLTDDA